MSRIRILIQLFLWWLCFQATVVFAAGNFVIAAVDVPQEINDYLREAGDLLVKETGKHIAIRHVNAKEFEQGIKFNEFAAFLIPSFLYGKISAHGLQGITVLTTGRSTHPNATVGAVVFFNSSTNIFRHLTELRGKTIGVLEGDNLSRHLVEADLVGKGLPKENLWSKVVVGNIRELLDDLYSDRIDAIILPSCYLEDHSQTLDGINTSWLLPVEEKAHSSMACFHSTTLLPGLVFGLTTRSTPEELITASQTLLKQPKGSHGEKWKVANDFRNVDLALKRLDLDEAAQLRKPGLKKFFELYKPYILTTLFIILFLIFNSSILTYLVKRRTAQLQQSLRYQEELKEKTKSALGRLERIQRLSVLGQLGSLFAHEIRQPLNAISCYSYILQRVIEKQKKTMKETDVATDSLNNIQNQTQRISIIIEKVRNYIKQKSTNRQLCRWNNIIDSAIATFETTVASNKKIKFIKSLPPEPVFINVDPVEIELSLINLFRNSSQAQRDGKTCVISLKLETKDDFSIVTVSDNGPSLSDSEIQRISSLDTSSAKPQGLGLGLSIVRFLIENHNGTVSFRKNPTGGLVVEIQIPLAKKE